ncbi:MAG: RluA family pseudouridine synthase [Gammaproteobacteria bacterium]|nr:RluA family pseudouridine synthase [Gammaproteobacteria bacterium]
MKVADSEKPSVRYVEIDKNAANQRVDNFLLTALKGVPKSWIYRVIRKGEVRVNKKRIKPVYRLCVGDWVRIPPLRQAAPGDAVHIPHYWLQAVQNATLYDDNDLLVINKPSGLAVHSGSGLSYGVIDALRQLRGESEFLELVHRLDRDTSGCLMIAKNRATLLLINDLLKQGGVKKTYKALLYGAIDQHVDVQAPLLKISAPNGERRVVVADEGKHADTHIHLRTIYLREKSESVSSEPVSYVDIEIGTGRTHQIRAHAAHIQHPVAGDDKYGDRRFNQVIKTEGLERLFLHAAKLEFCLDDGGKSKRISINAPLPDELSKVLATLAAPPC